MFFCRKHTANIISFWFWIAEISSLQKFFFFWYSLLSILESFKNAIVVQLISRLIIWLSRWENQKEAVNPTNLEATRKRLGVRNFHQPYISLFDVLKSQNFFWTLRWRLVISEERTKSSELSIQDDFLFNTKGSATLCCLFSIYHCHSFDDIRNSQLLLVVNHDILLRWDANSRFRPFNLCQ